MSCCVGTQFHLEQFCTQTKSVPTRTPNHFKLVLERNPRPLRPPKKKVKQWSISLSKNKYICNSLFSYLSLSVCKDAQARKLVS